MDPFPSDDSLGLTKGTSLPASGGAPDDPQLFELTSSAKYLTNWFPRIKGDKMIVEGCLLNFNNANPELYTDRYKTSRDKNKYFL